MAVIFFKLVIFQNIKKLDDFEEKYPVHVKKTFLKKYLIFKNEYQVDIFFFILNKKLMTTWLSEIKLTTNI